MLVYRTAERYELESRKFKVKSKKRSYCDYCGKQLRWYENIPVLSWIFLKGKSKCCHKKLSILYPVVESLMGILMVLVVNHFHIFSNQLSIEIKLVQLFWLVLVLTLLMFLVVFDFKYLILPDFAVFILIIISFLGVLFDEPQILPYLWSALGSFSFLGILYLVTKGKGIGFGDVKLAIFMGLFLGWPKIVVAMYLAFILGSIFGLVGIMLKKINRKSHIAFGPFLILGTIIAWIWGNIIFDLIVSCF